jgi:hypothetical protein
MKDTNVYVKKTLVGEETFDELDFEMHHDFKFNYDVHDDFVEIVEGQGSADGYPINIDHLIACLQRLKKDGATHVEMNYHVDHIGYEIDGYQIRTATQDEINKHLGKKKAKKTKETEDEINRLKKKLKDLEKSK